MDIDTSDSTPPSADHQVVDNPTAQRYELRRGAEVVSVANYRIEDDVMVVPHVETRPDLRNQGNSERLLEGLMADLRRRNLRILPLCPHAARFVRSRPQHHDLLA